MIMKDGTVLDSVKKRFKSRRGCGFQTQGLDSVDDNERWDCVGFCKNACMHVWGHVKWGCNGVLIETFPLVKCRGCGLMGQCWIL